MNPDVCPNCGQLVPPKAKACPECGACEETGWSDEARADSLGIPSEEFDYNEFVKREFEGEKPRRKFGAVWVITAAILLALIVWGILRPHVH